MTRTLVKGCVLICTLLLTACEDNGSQTTKTSNESVTSNGDQVVNSDEEVTYNTEQIANSNESVTNNGEQSTTKAEIVAIDNSGHEVKGTFNGHKVVVYTDTVLTKETSNATKPIYGNIDGKSTTSLLALNSNYEDGDVFWVKVFDGDEVVGESDEEVLDGVALEFGDIEIDGGKR